MTFTINKTAFSAALGRIQAIASGRTTMPILANVLLQLSALRPALHLTATDLEIGYTTVITLEEQPEHGCAITLPAKKLFEIVKACPATPIAITLCMDTQRATITSGTYTATLPGIDAGEYPELPQVDGETFDLDAAALLQILGNTDYAQSTKPEQYNLNGCHLRIETNEEDDLFILSSATDGHRLALDSTPLPGDPRPIPKDLAKGIIIPSKGIAELRKISSTGIIVLSIARNHLQVATDSEKLFLRLVDGQYPDLNKVIPRDLDSKIEVKRLALIEALDRVRILAGDKSHRTRLGITPEGITVSCTHVEMGAQATDTITAGGITTPIDIHISADYLLDSLKALSCGVVEISYKNELTPIMVTPLGTDEPMAIIMPQRG